jgi:DNA-binding beta-propeller fold protein YncE
MSVSRQAWARVLTAAALAVLGASSGTAQSFVNFESGHVRPLAASPDGSLLFAVNTPDNRLAIFGGTTATLVPLAEVPVGLEPVAVATRLNSAGRVEAWVVNHLSDSVSIVEVDPTNVALSRVRRTLLVGDEPRDIVFAGTGAERAFVTAAHRGQNRPGDPRLTTPGVGRADVWVFDAENPGTALGGTPVTILDLFGDTPRALAVSPDRQTVYAAVFHSGNQTTTITERVVTLNGGLPPAPSGAPAGAPDTGLIVKFNPSSGAWEDEIGRDWAALVPFDLPDYDVFRIAANANPPALVEAIPRVGTVLFNMAARPGSGKLYVTNLESRNHVRFEGIVNAFQGVKGHIAENRITIVDGMTPVAVHLNPHIDYLTTPGPPAEIEQSLAFPMDLVFSSDGRTLYVTAFGSGKVAVFDSDDLESGNAERDAIEVGGGPSGLVLDEARDRLYVMSRFTHRISVVSRVSDRAGRAVTASVPVGFDPSPPEVKHGRRVLYDARNTSGHGDSACASCHIFADLDSLAWDLGDPTASVEPNPNPFRLGSGAPFHPLKGPMTTQSLRGLAAAGPMHWRGDRTGGSIGRSPLDEDLAFKAFNVAFEGLLGRGSELTEAEMQAFTDFILTVRYPPNPIRALDDSASAAEAAGESFFRNTIVDGNLTCMGCHALPLGTDGLSSIEGEPQEFKIPHLRNMYQKIGMFGVPPGAMAGAATGFLGDQIRGFGFLHDGSVPTMFEFLQASVFEFSGASANQNRRNLEAFALAFDTGLKPAVGQQVSVASSPPDASVQARLQLLIARAGAGDCDLVVKGVVGGEARGAVYIGNGLFRSDRASEPLLTTDFLLGLVASGGGQTYTCVPPGSGLRIGIDRDEDGVFDRDEADAGTDPDDPTSFPGAPAMLTVRTAKLQMKDASGSTPNPARRKFLFKTATKKDAAANRVVAPASGGDGDPTLHGATLRVYNSNGSGEQFTANLPASLWSRVGAAGYGFKNKSTNAPVGLVKLKNDLIVVKGGKSGWGFTLDEPSQGRLTVRLTFGSAAEWCAEGTAATSGVPPSSTRSDRVDFFKAAGGTAAPPRCPVPPTR